MEKVYEAVFEFCKVVAIEAHKFLKGTPKIHSYCSYPCEHIIFPREDPQYDDLYQTVPYLKYGIPKFILEDFPNDQIQYGAIFNKSGNGLNITKITGYDAIYNIFTGDAEIGSRFWNDEEKEHRDYRIYKIIVDIIVGYLHSIKATEQVPEDFHLGINNFVRKKLHRYLSDKLHIDIYVPICLATFEMDEIEISENIKIVKIPFEVQKSRAYACVYDSNKEGWVASCATHMIVLNNYYMNNEEYASINDLAKNYMVYPIDVIDEIIAIIRIVTGATIGYEQILASPIGWIDSINEDLIPLYGAKVRKVNQNEINKFWSALNISIVDTNQCQKIRSLYKSLRLIEKKPNLSFALKRLNRCMLRAEDDDRAIDATIGLESLLAGGTKGEITYTISNRIPVAFSKNNNTTYSVSECRKIMKGIYNYRSKVVHGGEIKDKDRYYVRGDERLNYEDIAVDFLRQTILFILENPQFLDAKKIDEEIDRLIQSASIEVVS